jgi:hypothetical protein
VYLVLQVHQVLKVFLLILVHKDLKDFRELLVEKAPQALLDHKVIKVHKE